MINNVKFLMKMLHRKIASQVRESANILTDELNSSEKKTKKIALKIIDKV